MIIVYTREWHYHSNMFVVIFFLASSSKFFAIFQENQAFLRPDKTEAEFDDEDNGDDNGDDDD